MVCPSLLWGLETTRDQSHTKAYAKLASCQRMQIAKMLKSKRRPIDDNNIEPWLDYHIRTLRVARDVINRAGVGVIQALRQRKLKWAGHIARFGTEYREPHLLKFVLAWRCRRWWNLQIMYNDLEWEPIKHAPKIWRPRRWESQFSSNWMSTLAGLNE